MELSSSNIKKTSYIFSKERFYYIFSKERFSYVFSKESFSYIPGKRTLNFPAQAQKIKISTPSNIHSNKKLFLYFRR